MSTQRDALQFLPRTRVTEVPAHYVIFDTTRPADSLHVVVAGRVKLSRVAEGGRETLLRVVGPEELFGESVLLPEPERFCDRAEALERSTLMRWPAAELRAQLENEPRLALALVQYFGAKNLAVRNRVCESPYQKAAARVVLGLLHLSRTAGTANHGGVFRIRGLTHQAFADYVGTSREIATAEMNRLRKLGYLAYSRRCVDVDANALEGWLKQEGMPVRPRYRAKAAQARSEQS
jgi:CRP-like cAMP-binding protein